MTAASSPEYDPEHINNMSKAMFKDPAYREVFSELAQLDNKPVASTLTIFDKWDRFSEKDRSDACNGVVGLMAAGYFDILDGPHELAFAPLVWGGWRIGKLVVRWLVKEYKDGAENWNSCKE